jgi:hypothetical protein
MAKGGWSYGFAQIGPHANLTANWEASWDAISLAITGLGVGWSIEAGNTRYITISTNNGAWWRSWLHTSGARLVLLATGGGGSSGNLLLSSNNSGNNTFSSVNWENHLGFAYFPPGSGPPGAANPYISGFIPDGGFHFGMVGYDDTSDPWNNTTMYDGTGAKHSFHFIAKDDDLVILMENRSDTNRALDYVWVMGSFIGTLAHPAEETNTDLANECFLGCLLTSLSTVGAALSSSDSPVEFFRTPSIDGGPAGGPPAIGARRRTGGAFITWITTALSPNIHDFDTIGEEPWVEPMLYYSRSTDIDVEGVIAGSGLKGTLNPDMIRLVQGSGIAQRQILDGGNFLYAGGGLCVPWDPGLPAPF